jgi:predicted phosphodiesterase
MPAKKERVSEVVEYALKHGEDEACKIFGVKRTALDRYRRTYKEHFGESAELLLKIKTRYSEDELHTIANGTAPTEKKDPRHISFEGETVCFGAIGDTHIGSKYTDESFLSAAFEEFDKMGCSFYTHGGDVTEGMSGRDGHVYELTHIGYKAQKEAAIALLQQWKKPSYLVAGNHDLWYLKKGDIGADIVSDICDAVPDCRYLGAHEGSVFVNGAEIRLWHGEDTGSYSTSYRLQKLVESFTGGEKPGVLLTAHTHKQGYFFERNVHIVSTGAIQKQSGWMRYKRLPAHTGFHVIKMGIKDGEVLWFEPRWYPFYK